MIPKMFFNGIVSAAVPHKCTTDKTKQIKKGMFLAGLPNMFSHPLIFYRI